jgi:ribosome-associated protein YbcJ (S4-like RNA binding protein)
MQTVEINTPYITLGQLLKFLGIAGGGGDVKILVKELNIRVNQEPDDRRGRKCYPGDVVDIPEHGTWRISRAD